MRNLRSLKVRTLRRLESNRKEVDVKLKTILFNLTDLLSLVILVDQQVYVNLKLYKKNNKPNRGYP